MIIVYSAFIRFASHIDALSCLQWHCTNKIYIRLYYSLESYNAIRQQALSVLPIAAVTPTVTHELVINRKFGCVLLNCGGSHQNAVCLFYSTPWSINVPT